MRISHMFASATIAALIFPAAAFAGTINISINTAPYVFASYDTTGALIAGDVANAGGDEVTNNNTPYWTATYSFQGSVGDSLAITDLSADDMVGVELNGNIVALAGIFAPGVAGQATFFPTPTGPGILLSGALVNGAQSITSTGSFVNGLNTLELIIDNTNNGVNGTGLTGGQSSVAFTGAVTSSAPEPAAWAMMLAGFGGLGAIIRSRRKVAGAAIA